MIGYLSEQNESILLAYYFVPQDQILLWPHNKSLLVIDQACSVKMVA